VIFEYLELNHATAVTHVCNYGVIWRLMVLGEQQLRAGARAFHGGGEGGGAMLGGRVCDIVVTSCDLRRLEMAPGTISNSLLLLCLG